MLLNFLFFDVIIDANDAAPCATLLQDAIAKKNEPQVTAILANNCISTGSIL